MFFLQHSIVDSFKNLLHLHSIASRIKIQHAVDAVTVWYNLEKLGVIIFGRNEDCILNPGEFKIETLDADGKQHTKKSYFDVKWKAGS